MSKLTALAILLAAALGGAGIWYLERHSGDPSPPDAPISSEAKAYTINLRLSEVGIKATESYMANQIVEVLGKITNSGDKPVAQVELNCVFYDPYGQLVLRQRVAIVKAKSGGLKPGETKDFRLPFDNLPQSWNQAMPQLVIAQIVFG